MEKTVTPTPVAPVETSFNPLAEAVQEKTYANRNVQVDQSQLSVPIAEPTFNAPPVSKEKDPFAEADIKEVTQEKEKKQDQGFNPALKDLPPAQKEEAANHLTKLLMTGYQKLHDFGNYMIKISDKKITNLRMAGELDMDTPVPYGEGWMPMSDFFKEFNAQAGETLTIDPEFRAEVEPVITRVLAKHGHGLSDEAYLGVMFAQDMAIKGGRIIQMRSTVKDIIAFATEQTKSHRMGGSPAPQGPPVTAAPVVPISTQVQPQYQEQAPPPYQEPMMQGMQQAPPVLDAQAYARDEMMITGNGQGIASEMGMMVESSAGPNFGNKKNLNNLNRVAKKRSGTPKARAPRKRKGKNDNQEG